MKGGPEYQCWMPLWNQHCEGC